MSTQAIAIDAMLPAFPTIARALDVADENHVQLIVTAYMVGMGCGQLFWGLMADRFGRRPILLTGLVLYVCAAFCCSLTGSFSALLAFRCLHGVAAASVTVVRSVVRDLYSGRDLARVMSLTFMVFLMVPIIAPSLGQIILLLAPWRSIFIVFGCFASAIALWVFFRLRETLHPRYRLTLDRVHITHAVKFVIFNRTATCYTFAMMVMFGSIMAYVAMVQQIFADVFHKASLMPAMFALCAAAMGAAAYFNSRIVGRLGMRMISHAALLFFIAVTALHTLVAALGYEQLWTFVLFQAASMGAFGLAVSNFGAMAMEPVGAVAGIAASLQGFISTFSGALLGAYVGRLFNGTTTPLAAGQLIFGLAGLGFVLLAERGHLFHAHHAVVQPGALNGVGQVEGAGLP